MNRQLIKSLISETIRSNQSLALKELLYNSNPTPVQIESASDKLLESLDFTTLRSRAKIREVATLLPPISDQELNPKARLVRLYARRGDTQKLSDIIADLYNISNTTESNPKLSSLIQQAEDELDKLDGVR